MATGVWTAVSCVLAVVKEWHVFASTGIGSSIRRCLVGGVVVCWLHCVLAHLRVPQSTDQGDSVRDGWVVQQHFFAAVLPFQVA
jgi:hypothetical protein